MLIIEQKNTRLNYSTGTIVTQYLSLTTLLKNAILSLLLIVIIPTSAYAKDYMVEVLVFENTQHSTPTESHKYTPPKPSKTASNTWPLEPSMLLDDATRIENSLNYTLLHHYSWGQKALPYQTSANFRVIEQDINGWIKIYAEQLLFANLDLDYIGYRLNEKRRLKLNEVHFFDHPKFGVLLRVSRLIAAEEEQSNQP